MQSLEEAGASLVGGVARTLRVGLAASRAFRLRELPSFAADDVVEDGGVRCSTPKRSHPLRPRAAPLVGGLTFGGVICLERLFELAGAAES